MKKLILINGTMGVGKSTVCKLLLKQLQPSVYLDGDWCWNMNPFVVSPENKAMVMDNITHLLNSFLNNSGYEYVIFCWVIHQEEIFQQILEPVSKNKFDLFKISLICSEAALKKRLEADIENGIRESDVIERSVARIPLYRKMDTIKIDVSEISPQETAEQIIKLVK
jgi:cytidylate kinase